MNAAELKATQLEQEKRRAEDTIHELKKRIAALEAGAARSKIVITNLDAKAKRAQDAERKALERVALLETSLDTEFPLMSDSDFQLITQLNDCVIGCYAHLLTLERNESDEFVDIILGFYKGYRRVYHATTPSHREGSVLIAAAGPPDSSAMIVALRSEIISLNASLDEAHKDTAAAREAARKWRQKHRELELELSALYRRGIAAREAMLSELANKDVSAHQVLVSEISRSEHLREAQIARMNQRILQLETELREKNERVCADRKVSPRKPFR